ncbi:MAG: hypothetical protein JKY31_01710 [Rhodobacteraceae bacterium]|nr:hypothetical protein [Paracoccaceae bacterium]
MKSKFIHLWHEHRVLLIAFLAAGLFTALSLIRAIVATIYIAGHHDQPIEPWMPIGFIAKVYHVDPDILSEAAGIPLDRAGHRRLERISRDTGIPYDQLVMQLMDVIRDSRRGPGK